MGHRETGLREQVSGNRIPGRIGPGVFLQPAACNLCLVALEENSQSNASGVGYIPFEIVTKEFGDGVCI